MHMLGILAAGQAEVVELVVWELAAAVGSGQVVELAAGQVGGQSVVAAAAGLVLVVGVLQQVERLVLELVVELGAGVLLEGRLLLLQVGLVFFPT